MVNRTHRVGFLLVMLLLMPLAGCSGGDSDDGSAADKGADPETAVVGSFVGEVSGTEAFVAVVAAPAKGEKDSGTVQVYVSDGRRLSESFSGPISDGGFLAKSDDGDAEAEGRLTAGSVTGTVLLPGGKSVPFEASSPSGAAGVYELKVSSAGELSGASAAGLSLTGQMTLGRRGTGKVRLVDGKRLEFAVTRKRTGGLAHLRRGEVRLIVLSDGELRGVAKARPSNGRRLEFFLRSA